MCGVDTNAFLRIVRLLISFWQNLSVPHKSPSFPLPTSENQFKKTHAKTNNNLKIIISYLFATSPPQKKTQSKGAFFSCFLPVFFGGECCWRDRENPSVEPHLYLPTGKRQVIFVIIGFTWATGASVNFMSELLPEDRKAGVRGDPSSCRGVGLGWGWGCWGKILGWRWTQVPIFFVCLFLFGFFQKRCLICWKLWWRFVKISDFSLWLKTVKMMTRQKCYLKENSILKKRITSRTKYTFVIRQLFDVHSLSLESIVCLDIYYKCRTLAFMQVVRWSSCELYWNNIHIRCLSMIWFVSCISVSDNVSY